MPHIHTETGQHDLTTSAFIMLIAPQETPRIWLHWHKKLHSWLQFGGHVELHETPWQALAHEIREESGYDLSQLKLLQPQHRLTGLTDLNLHPTPILLSTHKFTAEASHYHTDLTYAFVTPEMPKSDISEGESERVQLFTEAELRLLGKDEIVSNVQEIGLYLFGEYGKSLLPVDTSDYRL